MRKYSVVGRAGTATYTLLELANAVDFEDDEFDRIADLQAGEKFTFPDGIEPEFTITRNPEE